MESERSGPEVSSKAKAQLQADDNLARIRPNQNRSSITTNDRAHRWPTLGKVVRDLRYAHGWQAKRLAIDAGISPELLSGLEKHGKMVSLYNLQKIAECFRVPLSTLFFMAENYYKEDVLNYPEQHFFKNTMELCYLLRSLHRARHK